jgi:hypothetical protein
MRAKLGDSERKACRVLRQRRSTQRYCFKKVDDEEPLTRRIVELATEYGRYGYRRMTALLREEGWRVNHKRAESLIDVQDATGVWYQIMDMPEEPGNYREASSSAIFTYFLAKGINRGYLPESFNPAAQKAYAGLVDEFIAVYADGSYHLKNNCEVGGLGYGRDGSYQYYMSERVVKNDPKGLGPAIMAGLQVSRLSN